MVKSEMSTNAQARAEPRDDRFGFELKHLQFASGAWSERSRQRADYMVRHRREYREKLSLIWRLLNLSSGGRFLSVGAGCGIDVCEWSRMGGRGTAVEINGSLCDDIHRFATLYGADVSVCQASADMLPFAGGRFDAVFTENSFEHFADPEAALREQYRVLKPTGRIVIIDGNIRQLIRVVDQLFKEPKRTDGRAGGVRWILQRGRVRDVYGSGYLCRDEDWHTPRWWRQRLRSHGFVHVDCRTTSQYLHPRRFRLLHPFCGQCLATAQKPATDTRGGSQPACQTNAVSVSWR